MGPPGEPGKPAEETDSLLDCVNRITSMCPNCEENGETRILLHRVPHFKDLLISSFSCPHCNYANREVRKAAQGAASVRALLRFPAVSGATPVVFNGFQLHFEAVGT